MPAIVDEEVEDQISLEAVAEAEDVLTPVVTSKLPWQLLLIILTSWLLWLLITMLPLISAAKKAPLMSRISSGELMRGIFNKICNSEK